MTPSSPLSATPNVYAPQSRRPPDGLSLLEGLASSLQHLSRSLSRLVLSASRQWRRRSLSVRHRRSSGRWRAAAVASGILGAVLRRVGMDLAPRRLLSVPHVLVAFWMLVLLWGERWVFNSRVASCDWDHWEDWPFGSTPHHLVLVADPQLTDPHSYPGRPWPLSSLTVLVTDNYIRRSYSSLQSRLQPDSVFFLGDLFDGGLEWKTARGDFPEPNWGVKRPLNQLAQLSTWRRRYGETFWLREYARFVDIFVGQWHAPRPYPGPGPWQRGPKLATGLPGNHDLGFGSMVRMPVRDRFGAFFGDTNHVDIIGNHTIVSVDSVSLAADTASAFDRDRTDLGPIYSPTHDFLESLPALKRRAVERELRFWRGEAEAPRSPHAIDDAGQAADVRRAPSIDPGEGASPDLPTILLTHVPLYRDPGTPCGPLREHWPPTRPDPGQSSPVFPDHRNSLLVGGGYQYQNVLTEDDSRRLLDAAGNVVHVFSGDDHDYCEMVHGDVREITVKSISMAMGVPTPGFLMVSLNNPLAADGRPLRVSGTPTLQTHLCLLPSQMATYTRYAALGVVTIVMLALRAALVPLLGLSPFAFGPDGSRPASSALPMFKDKPMLEKKDDDGPAFTPAYEPQQHLGYPSPTVGSTFRTTPPRALSNMMSGTGVAASRVRSFSLAGGGVGVGIGAAPSASASVSTSPALPSRSNSKKGHKGAAAASAASRGGERPLRIDVRSDELYDGGKSRGFMWLAAVRGRGSGGSGGFGGSDLGGGRRYNSRAVLGELWATLWRVVWMSVLIWAYLAWKG